MYSVTFSCPTTRVNKQGLSKIQLWVNVDGIRKTTLLELSTKPSTFTKELNSKRANNINTYCNNIRNTINTIFVNNPTFTAQEIIECFKNGTTTKKIVNTTGKIVGEFQKMMSGRIGVQFSEGVCRKYILSTNRFTEYIGTDKNITEITNSDIINFESWLRNTMKFDINTIGSYMKKIKYFLNWCIDNNYISTNPFKNHKISMIVREVEYLTKEEVDAIHTHNWNNERIQRVADVFVFACLSGLAFVDLSNLTSEDIQCDGNVHYIKKDRQKTGVTYTTMLNDTAMDILTKYDYKLPVLSNQKYNAYLKEIGDILGIKKNITTHIARHTFATLQLSKGYKVTTVQKMCGHSNINQTLHYAKIIDRDIFEEFTTLQ